MESKEIKKFIPLDKSWMIRMGFKDALDMKKSYCISKIESHEKKLVIPKDVKNLKDVLYSLKTANLRQPVSVGESATLYSFLTMFLLTQSLEKKITKEGTLLEREIAEPDVSWIEKSQKELLELDGGTSRWASAHALTVNSTRIENPPYKLALTYEAIDSWKPNSWKLRIDDTLFRQADHFANGGDFFPYQSEDFCYAYSVGAISLKQARKRWPQLSNHESNRFEEIERQLSEIWEDKKVTSLDHRVVQAACMFAVKNGLPLRKVQFEHKSIRCVEKSWPAFWYFVNKCGKI